MTKSKPTTVIEPVKPKLCFCRMPLKNHEHCEACGILTGPGHEFQIRPYHSHNIDEDCIKRWKILNRLHNESLTFEQMKNSKPGELHAQMLQLQK